MKADNLDQIYSKLLWDLHMVPDFVVPAGASCDGHRCNGFREMLGYQFKLTDPTQNQITRNNARGFKLDYAKAFFNYVTTGELGGVLDNKNAHKYLVEFEGRNTQYYPRIAKQLPGVIKELTNDKHSRRAVITILEAGDQLVLEGKFKGETNIEYPCTNTVTFAIRDDKLHLVVNMRSESAAMVLPYDVYNFTNIQMLVLSKMQEVYPELGLGTYTHQMASFHYYDNEEPLVKNILNEYGLITKD